MATAAIRRMLSSPTPAEMHKTQYIHLERHAVVTTQNTSDFTNNLLKMVDGRLDELVKYAHGLSNFYVAQRTLRQSTHMGSKAEKFDPLKLAISDARPAQNVVRLRWIQAYPKKDKGAGRMGLNWLKRDQGMQYNEHELLKKSAPFMRDVVKEVELLAIVLRIEIKATTRLRRSLVGFDREYLPIIENATTKVAEYCHGLADLQPYLPVGPVSKGSRGRLRKSNRNE